MKKDKKIELRVTAGEKEQIEKRAAERDETVSVYLLNGALNTGGNTDTKLRKAVATMLCRLNLVVETLESAQARNAIKQLEEDVWLCLR